MHSRWIGNEDGLEDYYKFKIATDKLLSITHAENISSYIKNQQTKFAAHIIWQPNNSQCKQLLFHDDKNWKIGPKVPNLLDQAVKNTGLSDLNQFARLSMSRKY